MANAAEFLARWKVRYIDAEGRILEELDTGCERGRIFP